VVQYKPNIGPLLVKQTYKPSVGLLLVKQTYLLSTFFYRRGHEALCNFIAPLFSILAVSKMLQIIIADDDEELLVVAELCTCSCSSLSV
jgi:hypothetical protein